MLKKISFFFLVGLFLFLLQCSRDDSPVAPTLSTTNDSDMAQQTHTLINNYRHSKGLPSLTLSNAVSGIAQRHSHNMAVGSVPFSHDGFDGRASAVAKQIKFSALAENVAWNRGYENPVNAAVEGWLKSSGHLENIVGDYTITGIGVVENEKGEYYFTQIFVKSY